MAIFTKRIDANLLSVTDHYNSHKSPVWEAYENSGSFTVSTEWQDGWGDWYGGIGNGSFRFPNITIPKNAIINSAKLTFVDNTGSSISRTLNYKITGIAEDNTSAFTVSPISTGRTRSHTSAAVDWDFTFTPSIGTVRDTPDIKTVIQEIVNRAGWASGNALGLYVYDDGTTPGTFTYYDYRYYHSYPATAPLLTIDWLTPINTYAITKSLKYTHKTTMPALTKSLQYGIYSPPVNPVAFSGLKVSKPGYNVLNESDPRHLNFTSDYNTLKYFTSGNIAMNVAYNANLLYTKTAYIEHNLGYFPFSIVYGKSDMMAEYQPLGRFQAGSGAYYSLYYYVTTSRLYVVASGWTGSAPCNYNVSFNYKLFKNNLGL